MYQRWRSLLFLHFPCEPSEVQGMLPPGLTVDTFPDAEGQEKAWIGLVPFRMEGVRPRFFPPAPGLSAFPETNLRTYVHRDGKSPGVWFFSLDADQSLACWAARRFFGLPYYRAEMSVRESEDHREYRSFRKTPEARVAIDAEYRGFVEDARPGTLEFFLIERYLLYSYRDSRLFTGQVHHRPYPLKSVEVSRCEEGLTRANGIQAKPFIHQIASEGVDVEIFPLHPCSKE